MARESVSDAWMNLVVARLAERDEYIQNPPLAPP